jgi:hypothetical protein
MFLREGKVTLDITTSPALIPVMWFPVSSTMPEKSAPRILSLGLNSPNVIHAKAGFPRRICKSAGLAEFAITLMRRWLSFTTGFVW